MAGETGWISTWLASHPGEFVAGGTLARCGPVNNHTLARHNPGGRMTQGAGNGAVRPLERVIGLPVVIENDGFPGQDPVAAAAVCLPVLRRELPAVNIVVAAGTRNRPVRPLESENGLRAVIKKRGFPAGGVMATIAGRRFRRCCKLAPVNVLMAGEALGRRRGIGDALDPGCRIRRAVASDAGSAAVRPRQRKRGRRVIEAPEVMPGPGRVAGAAAGGASICKRRRHPGSELVPVRVGMAGCAAAILETEFRRLPGPGIRGFSMAFLAADRGVRAI